MKEEWKRYRDTNYEVSNLGAVRNAKTNHILTKTKKYNGEKENDYERVKMEIDGKRKNKPVHRLVAECFLDNYSDDLEVNHKNSIKADNKVYINECTPEKRKTLYHELMHVFLYEYGHNQFGDKKWNNEDLCEISASSHDIIHEIVEELNNKYEKLTKSRKG